MLIFYVNKLLTMQIIYFPGDHGQLGLGGGLEEPLVTAPTTVKHSPWTEELLEDSAVEPDFIAQVRISTTVFKANMNTKLKFLWYFFAFLAELEIEVW